MTATSPSGKTRPQASAHRPNRRRKEALKGLFFIAPAMILVLVFFVFPVLFTAWMSLHKWPLLGAPTWIGLRNYTRMFSDERFYSALGFTAYYTAIVTVVIFAFAFPMAMLVEQKRRAVPIYRTFFFLPVVVGLASASLLWTWLSNVDSGFFSPLWSSLA